MHRRLLPACALAMLAALPAARAAGKPEDALAAVIRAFLDKNLSTDWAGVEKLPGIRWAPLPPTALQNCLPDGGCFTRQGAAILGGRKIAVVATGARTIVSNVYLRNVTAPFGEAAVLAALREASLSTELARCPVNAASGGGTNWHRISGAAVNTGIVSIQTSCSGKPCEGFVLTGGSQLPPLQPNQVRLYTEQCSAPEADRKPVSNLLPHEQLAHTLAALIPPAGGSLPDWKAMAAVPAGIEWQAGGPKKTDLSFRNDPNPMAQSAQTVVAGRRFSVMASGSPTQVKTLYFDEGGMHPKGEHMLGVLYTLGFAVKLARCGPVYTESTNNWYSITSAKTQPAMLRQSIRYEGNQVQDAYELRLDGTLPARDPRDRNPGVNGCR
ncbi:MAG: hypothetical protein R2762_26905 [Bryobacteraceae bacterium]